MFGELALGTTIHLQNAIGCAVTLQDDVHGPAHAMCSQQLRRPEALFILQVI